MYILNPSHILYIHRFKYIFRFHRSIRFSFAFKECLFHKPLVPAPLSPPSVPYEEQVSRPELQLEAASQCWGKDS